MSKRNTALSTIGNLFGALVNHGDKISAEVTKSGRKVAKIYTGDVKRSATYYPSTGRMVETISYKKNV